MKTILLMQLVFFFTIGIILGKFMDYRYTQVKNDATAAVLVSLSARSLSDLSI